jgi:hypothetical protein
MSGQVDSVAVAAPARYGAPLRPQARRYCLLALLTVVWPACSSDASLAPTQAPAGGSGPGAPAAGSGAAAVVPLPIAAQTFPLCAERAPNNEVLRAFCADPPPIVRGLSDVQRLLRLQPRIEVAAGQLARNDQVSIVATSHSTALDGHRVSPINPRIIANGGTALMAYQRGVQRLELIAQSDTNTFELYLISFTQACNERPQGCLPGDLYTPRVESNWLNVELQDAELLKNTPADCRVCHVRGREIPTLLMRELERPWTHFFDPTPDADPGRGPAPGVTGLDIMNDFANAKGDEAYGGVTLDVVNRGFLLEGLVGQQPLVFDSFSIMQERYPIVDERTRMRAQDPQLSPTWEQGYETFKRGEQLALPYFEQRATDLAKQQRLTEAYASYRAGNLEADALPDLADIFPDDPHVRAQIGLQTEPDATPVDALIQACATCHNDILDQTLSRARFNVALTRMDRAELDLAIERIQRPHDSAGAMPPAEARQLDPQVRDHLVEYLRRSARESADNATLDRVAAKGMLGAYP